MPTLPLLIRTTFLFVFWFLLSGKTKPFYLISGLLCALIIAWISLHRKKKDNLRLSRVVSESLKGVRYAFWLMVRIIQAAAHVSRLILDPKMPIRPKLIRHKTSLRLDVPKVIFANSITLTPGTITADLSGSTLVVHELDHASSDDIRNGAMEREITRIFKKKRVR